jgi:hypothetical protein
MRLGEIEYSLADAIGDVASPLKNPASGKDGL